MRMDDDREPRYEYRIWADNLERLRSELHHLARTTLDEQVSEEIYLIAAATDDCNAKIRGGRLNVKALSATERELELWKLVLDAEFPLDSSVIAAQLFPRLELPAPELRKPRYSFDEFVRDIVRTQSQLAMITSVKRRTRFQLDDCRAEFTLLKVGRIARETVAVESVKPDSVFEVIRQLQIAGTPNTSYIRQLKLLLRDDASIAAPLNRDSIARP
jgi:hypothetical protein